MSTPSQDTEAKNFQPEPGKASVYVNRQGQFAGGGLIIQMVLDGRLTGGLTENTFQLLSVPPGEHVLMTSGQFENIARIKFTALPDKIYFFDLHPSMGWALAHVNLTQIGEEEGKKAVTKSKRAEAEID